MSVISPGDVNSGYGDVEAIQIAFITIGKDLESSSEGVSEVVSGTPSDRILVSHPRNRGPGRYSFRGNYVQCCGGRGQVG